MNRKRVRLIVLGMLALFLLSGCGEEIVRLQFQAVGENEVTFRHDGSPVKFWTDLDVEYTEQPFAYYVVTVYKRGDQVAEFICDPFDISIHTMEREANVRGVTKLSYLGLMHCEQELPEGELTFEVEFVVDGRMTIYRADLVLKDGD